MAEQISNKKSKGKQCAVYGCFNFAFLKDGCPSGIHFFQIPKAFLTDKKKKERWCSLIKRQDGRDGFSLNNYTVVCEGHFKKEDISISLCTKRWTLKQGVEPSIFNWSSEKSTRKSPRKRLPLPSAANNMTLDEKSECAYLYECEPLPNCSNMTEDVTTTVEQPETESILTEDEQFIKESHLEEESFVESYEHDYSFSLEKSFSTCSVEDNIQSLRAQIENLNMKLEIASTNITELQEQVDYFESKRFTIDKIKDDDEAIAFYTGFQNYGTFISVFEYLQLKASRLQYWRGQNETTGG